MTLRLDEDDDRAVARTASQQHLSKHEVVVRAVRAYTSDRQRRLEEAITWAVERDAELLRRLGRA